MWVVFCVAGIDLCGVGICGGLQKQGCGIGKRYSLIDALRLVRDIGGYGVSRFG